jgi:hypothetical protein
MIHATSVLYEIETYDLVSTSLYPDGTPKAGTSKHSKMIKEFPQEVIDRVHALTDNLRFRRFVTGSSFPRIDDSWLIICLESSLPYRIVSKMRESYGLDMDQWRFNTFDEDQLQDFFRGGDRPDVDVMSFTDVEVATKAMKHLGAPNLLVDMKLRPKGSYFLFANHGFGLGIGPR